MITDKPHSPSRPSLQLPTLRIDQWAIVQHPAKIKLICCGRRWGKTTLCEDVAIATANEGGQVAWVVPTYKNSRAIWRLIEMVLRPLQKHGVRMRLSEDMVTFPNGGSLSVFSAHTQESADSIRGNAYHLVVMDEGARIDESTYQDVILPTLADYNGDLLIPSTPNGKNWFFVEYQRGLSDMQYQASFHAPTSANPSPNIQRAFEMARERLPERSFREEWLAEFVEDGAVFRKVSEAVERGKQPVELSGDYVMGLDWAQSQDYTAIVITDRRTKRIVEIDRFNQISWAVQRQRVLAAYERWQPAQIIAELNSIGSPNVEALQSEGLPVAGFMTTNESKTVIINALQLGFERGEISIPPDLKFTPVLISELNSFEAERLPSGKWRFSAPDGMHDDTVIATALSWYGAMAGMTVMFG